MINWTEIVVIPPKDKWDCLAESVIEGFYKNNIKIYSSDKGNGIKPEDVYTDKEIIEFSKLCDFIFVIWGKENLPQHPGPKYYLLDEINNRDKIIYIDGSEYNWTAHRDKTDIKINPNMIDKCKWYFKRECLLDHKVQGIIPLPFAVNELGIFNYKEEKTIDVLCSFGQTFTGKRNVAIQACEELKSEGYNIITRLPNTTSIEEYFKIVNQSWITIDAHGGGEVNARTFQISANSSALFCEKYSIIIPNLKHKHNCVQWNSKEDLKYSIRYYLDNKNELQKIIDNGYSDTMKYHTSDRRVKYIFKKIGEVG